MHVIAITGGIASGKSLVAKYLSDQYGAYIFDADKEAKDILIKPEVSNKILGSFPSLKSFTFKDISKVVFKSRSNQKKINDIIHPLVKKEIEERINEKRDKENIFVIDAPLIIESGMFNDFKNHGLTLVLVIAEEKHRIKRALSRNNLDQDSIMERIKLQMQDDEKIKYADFVIENNSSKESLFVKVDKFYQDNLE